MRIRQLSFSLIMAVMLLPAGVQAAYHHMGESDSDKFLQTYPEITGTKLDHCALCHSGGGDRKKIRNCEIRQLSVVS